MNAHIVLIITPKISVSNLLYLWSCSRKCTNFRKTSFYFLMYLHITTSSPVLHTYFDPRREKKKHTWGQGQPVESEIYTSPFSWRSSPAAGIGYILLSLYKFVYLAIVLPSPDRCRWKMDVVFPKEPDPMGTRFQVAGWRSPWTSSRNRFRIHGTFGVLKIVGQLEIVRDLCPLTFSYRKDCQYCIKIDNKIVFLC